MPEPQCRDSPFPGSGIGDCTTHAENLCSFGYRVGLPLWTCGSYGDEWQWGHDVMSFWPKDYHGKRLAPWASALAEAGSTVAPGRPLTEPIGSRRPLDVGYR